MSQRTPDDVSPPQPDSAPRRRVVDLLRRLAKASALGGAAMGLAAAESCSPLVCDPLPPPITCANPTRTELQEAMSLTGTWVAGDAGALEVHLQVSNFGRQSVTFSPSVTVTGGTLKSAVVSAGTLSVVFAPDAGATSAAVVVSFDCAGTSDAMTVTLTLGTPTSGRAVPAAITVP